MLKVAIVLLVSIFGVALAGAPPAFLENVRGGQRIVSGWESEAAQFPHQLNIRTVSMAGGVQSCGASIISADWALTAAHCTAQRVAIVVRAGAVNLTRPEFIFEASEFYNYPEFDNSRPTAVQQHDIALLKFNREMPLSDRIQPIRIQRSADKDKNYDGDRLIASGWGRTWTNGESPVTMNWVYLSGVSNEKCKMDFNNSPIVTETTICAGPYNVTSQSTCQGDSGGPLIIVDADGTVSLVGVTSFVSGTGCHTPVPAGFVRPGFYHEWITEVTGEDFDWELDPTLTTTTEEPSTTTDEPSTTDGTTTDGTTTDGTTTDGTTTDGTTTDGTTTDGTTTDGTTTDGTTTDGTTTDGTTTDGTTTDGTTTDGTTTDGTTTDGTTTDGTTTDGTTTNGTTTDGTTTDEPSTVTTVESSTTTDEPSTVTAEIPSTTTYEPSPIPTVAPASTTTDEPSTTYATTTDEPTTIRTTKEDVITFPTIGTVGDMPGVTEPTAWYWW